MISRNIWFGRKVLVNIPGWDPTYAMKNVGKLIDRLLHLEAHVTIFCRETPFLEDLKSNSKLTVFSYPSFQSRFFSFLIILIIHRFDLVLWTYSSYRENLLLAIWRKLGLLRFVIKSDSFIVGPRKGLRERIGWIIFKWVARSSDMVIVESPNVRDWSLNFLPQEKLFYMPNGVPLSTFVEYGKKFQKEQSPSSRPFFLYSGRIVHEKGLDSLIESFSMISNQIPEWDIRVVGPSRDDRFYEKCEKIIAAKGLEGRIIFHGFFSGIELYRWYYFASVFVLPSRIEGLPNAIPEAMFFKNPIIAYDVGKTGSMVDTEVGVLIPPGRIDLFSEAMKKLAEDRSLRESLSVIGHDRIIRNYRDDVIFTELLDRCESFLSSPTV